MICAELEQLEGELNEIIEALENPALTAQQHIALQAEYSRLSREIKAHQTVGHDGEPCFEE